MKKMLTVYIALIAVLALACPVSLASSDLTEAEELHANIQHVTDSPEWVRNLPAAQEANQLFVVAGMGMDKTTAFISMHRKDENGEWKQILSTPGFVGRNGLCPDQDHAEFFTLHPEAFAAQLSAFTENANKGASFKC